LLRALHIAHKARWCRDRLPG